MNIIFNGEMKTCNSQTLGEILVELGMGDMRLATAINGEFIPVSKRFEIHIKDGDFVEALSSMQGG